MAWRSEVMRVVSPLLTELVSRSMLTVSPGSSLNAFSISKVSASFMTSVSNLSRATCEGLSLRPLMIVGLAK